MAQEATRLFAERGVTFGVPEDDGGILHRPIPIDPLPRRLAAAEWHALERALVQRTLALDAFIQDVYGQQRILRAGRIPAHLVYGSASYLRGASSPAAQRPGQIAVAGIDLVKVDGRWLVLEDNVRVPSGISYALAARWATRRVLGRAMPAFGAARLEDYPRRLRAVLRERAPSDGELVVLSPGPLNAAYYEHEELARLMEAPLVTGKDLFASHRGVWRLKGAERHPVSAIYHRFSPDYLDPLAGFGGSVIGVPCLIAAWRNGELGLANAPTCSIADDKSLFPYVPDMVRYYLGEPPLLEQPYTLDLTDPAQRRHALAHFEDFVFKPVEGSGGKGIVFGPIAPAEERAATAAAVEAEPASLIAQPALDLERLPCLMTDGTIEWRRCDLRPFVLLGSSPWVVPGGLTRVAPTTEAWLVNSSAGGGVKDTWVAA
ncbi:MAG TPA: circularly permuted type 2 ATP-grasp protein [Candidatus Dormibacteraeota bacterium]|nr:circularly permuted type 2 ATP-grasp protein [Candidatus Dormibacteraeota bacterium]